MANGTNWALIALLGTVGGGLVLWEALRPKTAMASQPTVDQTPEQKPVETTAQTPETPALSGFAIDVDDVVTLAINRTQAQFLATQDNGPIDAELKEAFLDAGFGATFDRGSTQGIPDLAYKLATITSATSGALLPTDIAPDVTVVAARRGRTPLVPV